MDYNQQPPFAHNQNHYPTHAIPPMNWESIIPHYYLIVNNFITSLNLPYNLLIEIILENGLLSFHRY